MSSINFDGTDDRATTSGSVIDLKSQPASFLFWMFADQIDAVKYLFNINDGSGVRAYTFLQQTVNGNGQLQIQMSDSTQAGTFLLHTTVPNTVKNMKWHHIAVTHDGVFTTAATARIYVDFKEASYQVTTDGAGTQATCSGSWSLGGRTQDNTVNFNGKISHFRFFNRELKLAEIIRDAVDLSEISNLFRWAPEVFESSSMFDLSGYKNHPRLIAGARYNPDDPLINLGYVQPREYGFTYPLACPRHNRLRRWASGAPPVTGRLLEYPGMEGLRRGSLVGGMKG